MKAQRIISRTSRYTTNVVMLLILLFITMPYALAQEIDNVTLLALPGQNLPIISCNIDGTQGECLLDTGSEVSLVTTGVVGKVSHRVYNITTVTGESKVPVAKVDVSLSGIVKVQGVTLFVSTLPKQANFQAILGENFLRTFNKVSIDYTNRRVTFEK